MTDDTARFPVTIGRHRVDLGGFGCSLRCVRCGYCVNPPTPETVPDEYIAGKFSHPCDPDRDWSDYPLHQEERADQETLDRLRDLGLSTNQILLISRHKGQLLDVFQEIDFYGELSTAEIALETGVTRSTARQHANLLSRTSAVEKGSQGRENHYRVPDAEGGMDA